jgi:hypothetical protein
MKYAADMGSHAMIYTKFHKDWFRCSKVNMGGGYRDKGTAWRQQNDTYIFNSTVKLV